MYNKPVPDVLTAKGKEILEYLDINWEWVDRLWKFGGRFNYSNDAVLKEAMTHSPLQVVVLNNTHCEMAYKVQGHNTFNSYKGTEHKIYNDCTEWAYPVKCNISVKKKKAEELMKFTTYKIHGNPTICVKVRGEDALLAFAGGVLEGGTLFKSLYDCEYSDMPREYVDKWQYPIKYEITTIKS